MSALEEIAQAIEYAKNNSSGVERKIYENMSNYVQTNNEHYMNMTQKYYEEADNEARRRAKQLYEMMAEHYYRNK